MTPKTIEYMLQLDGLEYVKSVGELVEYALTLERKYGDVDYACGAHNTGDFFEEVFTTRTQKPEELELELSVEEFTERLHLCHDKKVHQEALDRIGEYHYGCIISKLNRNIR